MIFVYFLVGNDPKSGEPTAYVGEAEKVSKRLKQHLSRDSWTQVIAVVSKDENLTKAHTKYLEGKLIELGIQAGRGVIQNSQSSGARLPEADQAEMDIFLDRVLKLLPIMGTSIFTQPEEKPSGASDRLSCMIKDLVAYGNRTENGFLVYEGSQAVLEHRPSASKNKQGYYQRRESLANKSILIKKDGHYVFTQNHEFTSPSLAAAVVCGGAENGLKRWRDKEGKTLSEIEKLDS